MAKGRSMVESLESAPTICRVNPIQPHQGDMRAMAAILRGGGLVVFPTETFYGLGAHAFDHEALERVYALKGRPGSLPLLCLVDGEARLGQLVSFIPPWVRPLIRAFWPGPLTLVLSAVSDLPRHLVAPGGGVAVRWSSHPVAQGLVAHLQAPLVGTSANRSGESPPSRVADLSPLIRRGVQGILDGGPTGGENPSTVLDCTRRPATVIREGAVSGDALAPFLPPGPEERG